MKGKVNLLKNIIFSVRTPYFVKRSMVIEQNQPWFLSRYLGYEPFLQGPSQLPLSKGSERLTSLQWTTLHPQLFYE